MYINDLSLINYRNIRKAEVSLQNGINAVFGENGQGKTNLLESIFLLSGAKPFRKCPDKDLIQNGENGSTVSASFFSEERMQQIKLIIDEKGRQISLNKGTVKKASAAAGSVCCVVFSPDHLDLIKGSPEERRKFIDMALCQISKTYLSSLRLYSRLLSQKNNILKDCYSFPQAADLLSVYDEQLAQAAAYLTAERMRFGEEILKIFSGIISDISGNRDNVSFRYKSTLFRENVGPEEALARFYETRSEDIRCGYSTVGPHRDDLEITLDGKNMKIYGSQGQQRSAVLALKLAEARYFRERTEEEPVLLLDDVLSELDLNRQNDLLDRLNGRQSVITCCDPTFITGRTDARLFRVEAGQVETC